MAPNRVFTINRRGTFSLPEARELLPVIRRITKDSSDLVETKMAQLEAMDPEQTVKVMALEEVVNDLISAWHTKIRKLGAEPKGLWLVDFDCGTGYYCWKFPETDLTHWHKYGESYTKRRPLDSDPSSDTPVGTDDQAMVR